MKEFKQLIKLTFTVLVIGSALLLTTALALAQSGARVFVQPVEQSDGNLVVDIVAENVTDLYGAEFRLSYDPTVVTVQDFKPEQDGVQIQVGTLLAPDKGFVVANQVDETAGTVTFAMTLLNPAPAVSGSGPLARVSFTILQNTPSTINVEHAKLVSLDLETIPSQTAALAIGSDDNQPVVVANAAPPASEAKPVAAASTIQNDGFPWWIVAAVIMVLGILALGGFIVMDGLKSASTGPANRQSSR